MLSGKTTFTDVPCPGALLMSSLTLPHLDVSDQERATAALTIATELITGAG